MSCGSVEQILIEKLTAVISTNGSVAFDVLGKLLNQLNPGAWDDFALQSLRGAVNPDTQGQVSCDKFFTWLFGSGMSDINVPSIPPLSREKSCLDRLHSICEDAILQYEVINGVAVISLGSQGPDETLPWGTLAAEHRLYPGMVKGLLSALDRAEGDAAVEAVVVTASGKYWSNGFDLKWIQTNPEHADTLQQTTELICSRVLKFPKPTIAAVNGHATAAGAMLLLSFDVKVMNTERGLCFVPGIDLGLVYSPGMTALMVAKLPLSLRHNFIVFGHRQTASSLLQHGVIDDAVESGKVLEKSMEWAAQLKPKSKHGSTMARIKETLYHEAIAALECEPDELMLRPQFVPMGFAAVPLGIDRPGAGAAPTSHVALRRAVSCAKAQEQVQSDLLRISNAIS